IEARVDFGFVGARQILFAGAARPTDALGDILARQFDVHAAKTLAHRAVDVESLLDFADDVRELARLHAARSHVRVAMHRIAHPKYLSALGAHLLDQARQPSGDLAYTESMDQRQSSRCAIRIEHFEPARHLLARRTRAHLDPDRILDAAHVF